MVSLKHYKYPSNQDLYPCERKFLQRLPSGLKILELGPGTGRVFLNLLHLKPSLLVGIDINDDAVDILRRKLCQQGMVMANVQVFVGDVTRLNEFHKHLNCLFDLVIFAFNGLDYLYPIQSRHAALREIGRILSPGGLFYFSSLNPLGIIMSPRGLYSLRAWKLRLKYIMTGQFLKQYTMHSDGFPLYQSLPSAVIREVESVTALRFIHATDRTGLVNNLLLLTLFSAYPYYLFRKRNMEREL